MSIEGIPDGWELVRFDYANKGESFLNGLSEIILHIYDKPHPRKWLIIRKIEKPKKYRPFQNPTEAESLLGEVLRFKADHESKALFVGNMPRGVQVGLSLLTFKQAFETLEMLDGTPFGIEVTE